MASVLLISSVFSISRTGFHTIETARARIAELGKLEKGWLEDGYGEPMSLATQSHALSMLEELHRLTPDDSGIRALTIGMDEEGFALFEFYDGVGLFLEIRPDATVSVFRTCWSNDHENQIHSVGTPSEMTQFCQMILQIVEEKCDAPVPHSIQKRLRELEMQGKCVDEESGQELQTMKEGTGRLARQIFDALHLKLRSRLTLPNITLTPEGFVGLSWFPEGLFLYLKDRDTVTLEQIPFSHSLQETHHSLSSNPLNFQLLLNKITECLIGSQDEDRPNADLKPQFGFGKTPVVVFALVIGDLDQWPRLIDFLHRGRLLGDRLVVGVISPADAGRRLFLTLEQRVSMLESCRWVDQVIPNPPLPLTREFLTKGDPFPSVNLLICSDDLPADQVTPWTAIPLEMGIMRHLLQSHHPPSLLDQEVLSEKQEFKVIRGNRIPGAT